jgi:hypothetical protein
MSDQCLIAEYESIEQAKMGLRVLSTTEEPPENVSFVAHSERHASELQQLQKPNSHPPTSGKAVGIGALIGGAAATPLALGSLIGPLFVAGPLLGMAAGAAIGGLFASAHQWGLDRSVSEDLQQRVNEGAVLIIVNSDDPIVLNDAEQLLATTDPKSLSRYHRDGNPSS